MTDDIVIHQLTDALERFDWSAANRICDGLIAELNAAPAPFSERSAKTILTLLRRKRQFQLMGLVADAFIRGGLATPLVLRQYAQAMIDQGNLVASQMVLQNIIADDKTPADERAEAKGLLGRIFKQLYVNANDSTNLRQRQNIGQAIAHYYAVYQTKPGGFLWHGINTVALLARAHRDRVPVQVVYPEYGEIALQIRNILAAMPSMQYWDRATAVEAAVALGDTDGAFNHALEYARDSGADAFEIASLLRQLTEVWQLTPDVEPGDTLLPILKAALLKRGGGTITVAARRLASESVSAEASRKFERVFGTDRYQPLGWLQTALKRCNAVGAVEAVNGKRIGTGFLVKAADFFPARDKSELLFLTNAHVISPVDTPFPGALPPDAARVVFEATNKRFGVTDVIWSSSPSDLDATFISLDGIENSAELCPLTPAPEPFDVSKKPRVYVIGYPLGGSLSISLQDSHWIDIAGPFLHYRTPTEPGSSGSPVFDDQYWTVIGLHHAGDRDPRFNQRASDEANEAIAIAAIQQRTRAAGDAPAPTNQT